MLQKVQAQSGMSRRHLCKYGAFAGFLRGKDVRSVAQASKSNQESFANGDFLLHLRLETHQLSRMIKDRIAREEALQRMVPGLARLRKSPLLSLEIREPGAFRGLYPLILAVLKESENLQKLTLHDISIDPIRAPHAAGEFHREQALQLTGVFNSGSKRGPGGHLTNVSITAGCWSWEALCILFESLSRSPALKHLSLRGQLSEHKDSFQELKELVVLKVATFCWQGSDIYDARFLESLLLALPLAELRFRMEDSGAWRGISETELRAFEQLSCLNRIKVYKDQEFIHLQPGVLGTTNSLRALMTLRIAPQSGWEGVEGDKQLRSFHGLWWSREVNELGFAIWARVTLFFQHFWTIYQALGFDKNGCRIWPKLGSAIRSDAVSVGECAVLDSRCLGFSSTWDGEAKNHSKSAYTGP